LYFDRRTEKVLHQQIREEYETLTKLSCVTPLEVAMKQISNKEYEKYRRYQNDMLYGRILTPDGLRIICASLDNDPEKIGIHMLEMLTKFGNEGIFDIAVSDDDG